MVAKLMPERIYDPRKYVIEQVLDAGESLERAITAMGQISGLDPKFAYFFRQFRFNILAFGGQLWKKWEDKE